VTTRIKICGITRQQDADAVVLAGADALGLMFVAASPRWVDVPSAAAIAAGVRGAVTRVGVFMDAPAEAVNQVLDAVELDMLQFHGSETGAFCRSFGLPFMKALRVRGPLDIQAVAACYAGACCLLLDAYVPGVAGGTGATFDWAHWPGDAGMPLVLAGGLTPDTVAGAIQRLRPWGVDVSGGVEGLRRGEKDSARIREFVKEVKHARR